MNHKHYIFLQHGVVARDMSEWLNGKEMDIMVTTTPDEFHSIADKDTLYKLLPSQVKMVGLPRHDALLHQLHTEPRQKVILIMPTWRQNLGSGPMKDRGSALLKSKYYKAWDGLFKSEALKNLAEKYQYRIAFFPHPLIRPLLNGGRYWKLPPHITLMTCFMGSIQKAFLQASIMITDYSLLSLKWPISNVL
jgi:CDP-glycerol glycerophosphotransferase (TagB/SpsB family)